MLTLIVAIILSALLSVFHDLDFGDTLYVLTLFIEVQRELKHAKDKTVNDR